MEIPEVPLRRRWLHVRHPGGFNDAMFEAFRAGCRLWSAHVQTSIEELRRLKQVAGTAAAGLHIGEAEYAALAPELSADRTVATLPLDARSTLGSRAWFENGESHLLWHFLPASFLSEIEEGLTEDLGEGPVTHWRRPPRFTGEGW